MESLSDKLREPKDTRVGVQLFHLQQYRCESGFLDAVHVWPGIGRHDIVFRLVANGAVHQRLPRTKAGNGERGSSAAAFDTRRKRNFTKPDKQKANELTLSFLEGQFWGLESAVPLAQVVGFRWKWWKR